MAHVLEPDIVSESAPSVSAPLSLSSTLVHLSTSVSSECECLFSIFDWLVFIGQKSTNYPGKDKNSLKKLNLVNSFF